MPRRSPPDPPGLPLLITMAAARRAGLTEDQVRQRVRSGRWERVAQGTYRLRSWREESGLDDHAIARVSHVQRAVALAQRNPGTVIARASAALAHGMPVASGVPDLVSLLRPGAGWTGIRSGARFVREDLPGSDVDAGSVPVTTAERTWVDLARLAPLGDAVAAGDAGLRAGVLSPGGLAERVCRLGPGRGCRRAALALRLVDGRRESVLESLSWVYFWRERIVLPECQVEIVDPSGWLVGRVDALWREAGLVGECDGRLKYTTPADLYAEKRREDLIRALGYRVVRWGMADLRGPRLATTLRSLLR